MVLTGELLDKSSDSGNPLPRCSVLDGPVVSGRIKARHEDFLVEELPLYEPTGTGEHLYLWVQKRGLPHTELLRILRQHFRVHENAIGFAGMKDKLAVTRQLVSIHLPDSEPDSMDIRDKRVQVLWSTRHHNKLRRGHLAGNRFSIRIRETDPLKAPLVFERLNALAKTGVPNYYGFQRFGYRRNTHRLGFLVLHSDWEGLVAELLGATGSPFPDRQREARELVDQGKYEESLPKWSHNEHAERVALKALSEGASAEEAIRKISKYTITFWVSAFQSAVFNRVLDRRLEEKRLTRVDVGDIAMRQDSRRQFIVHEEIHADPKFEQDVREFAISATGPMWGRHMLIPLGQVHKDEVEVLHSLDCDELLLDQCPYNSRGTRRPVRIALSNIEVDSGVDEDGGYIRTAFDLPRGSYATVVLREFVAGIDPDDDLDGD